MDALETHEEDGSETAAGARVHLDDAHYCQDHDDALWAQAQAGDSELVEPRTERDAIKAGLEAQQVRHAAERQDYGLQLAQLREERDDWKARHDAVRAELDARRASGWAWFPRLLSSG